MNHSAAVPVTGPALEPSGKRGWPKFLRQLRYQIFYGLLLSRRYSLVTLGDTSLGLQWTLHPDGLDSRSIVYAGGVGGDITFEHALVNRCGCRIELFDPSPSGLKTMELPENRIPQFRFHPVALTSKVGTISMAPPPPGEVSWYAQGNDSATIQVPSTDLASLMRKNGHEHIDLIKIDIEGSEYEVIEDILKKRIPIRQICVEYHHGIVPGIRRSQTIRSMLKLVRAGYKLLYQEGANHTFLKP
ncbi:MAG: FkbM family methyltransferase [Verrucomicrobiota bacterium]